ncbi:MAG TPA: hypothetical protein VKF17_08590 [Isosphaeraceae bacterium]|nr:hypothetical protein [Isosphaeraceae bacterium]
MVKRHEAGKQKKLAKKKAMRSEKRARLLQFNSKDPTVRLRRAEKWPVVQALVGAKLWEDGIGYLMIARQEAEGRLVFGVYLVDVYCLGVKNAFWSAGTPGDFQELIKRMEETRTMIPISPACLVKIVEGALEYAQSFGFPPHSDYRHAAMLLEGIDPQACAHEFTFGREGKPFYIQGPNESPAQVSAIMQRIQEAGGHFIVQAPGAGSDAFADFEAGDDEFDLIEEEDFPDESP